MTDNSSNGYTLHVINGEVIRAPVDLSPRVVSLARMIDRLPDDSIYLISIEKYDPKWVTRIEHLNTVKVIDLTR